MKSPSSSSPRSSLKTGPGNAPAFDREDLPASFQPRPLDVIIGRGKQVNKHNDKNYVLQDLLQSFAGDYLYGKKERKSELLTIVVQEIRATGCAFIKKERINSPESSDDVSPVVGAFRWYSVDETAARNSAAQFLRNHLSENYKSSKQFKKKLRMDKKNETTKVSRTASVVSTSSAEDDDSNLGSSSSNSSLTSCENERPALPSSKTNFSYYGKQFLQDRCEPNQPESLLTLMPPRRSSGSVPMSQYQSKLLSEPFSTGYFDQNQQYPTTIMNSTDDMDAIMNMELPNMVDDYAPLLVDFDDLQPRPIASATAAPYNGKPIFQSAEDEDLFLSWSCSGL